MTTVQPAFDPAELPVYWREADARRVLDAWRATGSSMAAFARASGLPVERIRRWRRRLEGADEEAPRFVQLVVADRQQPAPSIKVHLDGVTIEVPPGFDEDTLLRVVDLLSC